MSALTLRVNGVRHRVHIEDDDLLLTVLRDRLGVTSVRLGCGVGACGACTVLASGRSMSSCLVRAIRCDGADITTADGLPQDDDVVAAFVESNAMQCGYCIPGFVLMAHELLAENSTPTRQQIIDHLEGNLCRCGTYLEIIEAVAEAASRGRVEGQPA